MRSSSVVLRQRAHLCLLQRLAPARRVATPAFQPRAALQRASYTAAALSRSWRTSSLALDARASIQQARGMARMVAAASSSFSAAEVVHILVPPGDEGQALLDDLQAKIEDGADFGALAAEHSKCPSAAKGGNIGWVTKGKTVPEFERAVFEAEVGELVQAETSFGLHLMRIERAGEEPSVRQMPVEELAELIANPDGVQFIDVREEGEFEVAKLPHFQLRPLSQFQTWVETMEDDFDPNAKTVVLCHHGMRSMQAATFFVSQAGFTEVYNVTGGINAYSNNVDESVPRY